MNARRCAAALLIALAETVFVACATEPAPPIASPPVVSPAAEGPRTSRVSGKEWLVGPDEWGSLSPVNEAIAAAQPGDAVWLKTGVYLPAPGGGHCVLNIERKRNLLVGAQGPVYIFSENAAQTLLCVARSEQIQVEGLGVGHLRRDQECEGFAAWVSNSRDVRFTGCVLDGSGASALRTDDSGLVVADGCALTRSSVVAVSVYHSIDVRVQRSLIAHTARLAPAGGRHAIVWSAEMGPVLFERNVFWDNAGRLMNLRNTKDVLFRDNRFSENRFDPPAGEFDGGRNSRIAPFGRLATLAAEKSVLPDEGLVDVVASFQRFMAALQQQQRKAGKAEGS